MIYKIKSDASGYLSQETAYLHPHPHLHKKKHSWFEIWSSEIWHECRQIIQKKSETHCFTEGIGERIFEHVIPPQTWI